jgi:hypothetical protein
MKFEDIKIIIEQTPIETQTTGLLAKIKILIPFVLEDQSICYWISRGWVVRSSAKGLSDNIRGKCFVSAPSIKNQFGKFYPLVFFEDVNKKAYGKAFLELADIVLTEYYRKTGHLTGRPKSDSV